MVLATDSFLDEVFGRLADDVPMALLNERCRITHANPTIRTMLRVAVRERRRLRGDGSRPTAVTPR